MLMQLNYDEVVADNLVLKIEMKLILMKTSFEESTMMT